MIKQGDVFPAVTLKVITDNGPEDIELSQAFAGKKVVLFAVPGAFTPTCSAAHLPGFVVQFDELKAKGVDVVACVSVNDAFVMAAWSKTQNAENILMLADGNADLTEALGLKLDGRSFGMGIRSKRYAMVIDDLVVFQCVV